jgi:hypothetical protein
VTRYARQFLCGFVIDFFYVAWIKSVQNDEILLSGITSLGIALPSIIGYTAIFDNRKMIFPYLLGLFIGTMLSVSIFN